jgi:hypothetical protein
MMMREAIPIAKAMGKLMKINDARRKKSNITMIMIHFLSSL